MFFLLPFVFSLPAARIGSRAGRQLGFRLVMVGKTASPSGAPDTEFPPLWVSLRCLTPVRRPTRALLVTLSGDERFETGRTPVDTMFREVSGSSSQGR